MGALTMGRAVAVLLLGACGRIAFDPLARDPDAPAPDTMPTTFATPVPIVELNSTAEDDDPTLTDDQLEIYFTSDRAPSQLLDIWRSTRDSVDAPWNPPVIATELSSSVREKTPDISADGLTMFFARQVAGSDHDVFVATRADRDAAWSAPVRVVELSTAGTDSAASPDPDLRTIVLTRGEPGATATSLVIATRERATDAWNTPVAIPELDETDRLQNQSWLGPSSIWFTSNVIPDNQELRFAPRTGRTTFGTPQPIPELDLPGAESDPWLTPDERVIYFEHDNDLFMSRR